MAIPDILKISFEFSSKLGVRELPQIDDDHQSNVRGLYIVGDLADAPIIKVALRQGNAVATHVADSLGAPTSDPDLLDVVVIGAGPAGIGAALALKERGMRYVVIEREAPFSTIQNFPRAKLIFSEPKHIDNPAGFWFEDARKEDLVDRWSAALDERALPIQQPEEVLDAKRQGDVFTIRTRVGDAHMAAAHAPGAQIAAGSENTYRARRVILAGGKRGQARKLGVPGEDLPHVHFALKDPRKHVGRKVLVVGGGDSAVEAAVSLADAGADVTVSYRGATFHRAKLRNQRRIQAAADAGTLSLAMETSPTAFLDDRTRLGGAGATGDDVLVDDVFVFIGNKLPLPFLRRLGVKMQGDMDALRAAWIVSFALVTYLFYVLKGGADCVGGVVNGVVCEGGAWVAKKAFFPFGPGQPLDFLPGLLKVDLGFREVDGSFWGTTVYAALILVFGLRARARYPGAEQKRRYVSLIVYQCLFLFGIPELLAPLVIERPWKVYALTVPWPLSTWSLIDAPSWVGGDTVTAALWIGAGALTSFVAVPLYVRRNGVRFCSYLCGCGGLAETLGDFWRHLAPRGRTAKQSEVFGRIILVLAVPVTLLILNDAWGFFATGALYDAKNFAQQWYGLMVDFWLASVVGVALYPYLGNRVWCRFFCPLRAWMEELARRFTTLKIVSNDKCIGCGECTRYCQMGIDVQRFGQTQIDLSNHNSSCIQCGICIEVCPMDVLSIGRAGSAVELVPLDSPLMPPKASWER